MTVIQQHSSVLLPFELVKEIFKYLDRSNLRNCLSVCHQWNQAALIKLRETLYISDFVNEKHHHELMDSLEKSAYKASQVKYLDVSVNNNESSNNNYQYYARDRVTTNVKSDDGYTYFKEHGQDLLQKVIELCPNIFSIVYTGSRSSGLESFVWSWILEAVKKGHAPSLQYLPRPCWDLMHDYYLPVAFCLKSRLKEIYICNRYSGGYRYGGIEVPVFQPSDHGPFGDPWIKTFECLEKLTLTWNGSETLLDCDALIENCPNQYLSSVELNLDSNAFQHQQEQQALDPSIVYHAIPRHNIKRLVFDRGMLANQIFKSDILVEYIMKKFPRLNEISFLSGLVRDLGPLELSPHTLEPFYTYLSNIQQLKCSYHVKLDDVQPILKAFMTNNTYLKTVDISYTGFALKHLETAMILIYSPMKEYYIDGSMMNNVCSIKICLPYSNVPLCRELVFIPWLNQFGDKINVLKISEMHKINLRYIYEEEGKAILEEYEETKDMVYGGYINQALKACTAMKHFILDHPGTIQFYNNTEKNCCRSLNYSIEQFTLLEPSSYSLMEDRPLMILSKQLPSLKYMRLRDTCPSKQDEYKHTMIEMPYSSFQEFVIEVQLAHNERRRDQSILEYMQQRVFYLKVTTERSGVSFIYLGLNSLQIVSTEHDIHSFVTDSFGDGCLLVDIHCKSLNTLRLQVNVVYSAHPTNSKKYHLNL